MYRTTQIKAAIKVNSQQLLFNWQLGRDLVVRKAEEKWGNGIVEQVSLDLQAEFPQAKGFSTTNLWYMKKWYLFYTSFSKKEQKSLFMLDEWLDKETHQFLPCICHSSPSHCSSTASMIGRFPIES